MTHIAIKFVYIQFDDNNWTRTAGPQIRYTAKNNGAGLWVVWFDRSWSFHFTLKKTRSLDRQPKVRLNLSLTAPNLPPHRAWRRAQKFAAIRRASSRFIIAYS
jgi:hypothetical protein